MWRALLPNPFCLPALLPEGMTDVTKPGNWLLFVVFCPGVQDQTAKRVEGKEQLFWTEGGDTSTVSI